MISAQVETIGGSLAGLGAEKTGGEQGRFPSLLSTPASLFLLGRKIFALRFLGAVSNVFRHVLGGFGRVENRDSPHGRRVAVSSGFIEDVLGVAVSN